MSANIENIEYRSLLELNLLQVNTIPKLILQNPYRILGVYANSSQKEIVGNKGKATAFIKVGKPIEFPLDLNGVLPPLSRTIEMFDEAEAHLAIAKEKLLYAQFWFLKKTPLDDIAFNHLLQGNLDEALSIWGKQDNPSSIQNRVVCYFIIGDITHALSLAKQLYVKCGDTYINNVDASSTLQMSTSELEHLFLDALGEDVGMMQLMEIVSNAEWKSYIGEKLVSPLISKISSEVERAKKVDHKIATARKDAGKKLIDNTKESLKQLQSVLSRTDSQYQMIADKLGLEILQCGIDYYNNTEEDDAAITAMNLQKYAQSVVVGTLAKQRCDENVKILKKIIDNLPPKDVRIEVKAIHAQLELATKSSSTIYNAQRLLENTKIHLQSMKNKLGSQNGFYLKTSTLVVQIALSNVIQEVNDAQRNPFMGLGWPNGSNLSIGRLKDAVREAWKVTLLMDGFDIESSFKEHYKKNRNTLKSMCNQLDIPTSEDHTGCVIGSVIIIVIFIISCIANCH